MPTELKIPTIGESISEVDIGDWHKSEGDAITKDENLVVIESEKATIELPSPMDGVLSKVLKSKGQTAKIGEVIAYLEAGTAQPAGGARRPAATPQVERAAASPSAPPADTAGGSPTRVMPAAERALAEHGLHPEQVPATGPGGRLLKEDVLRHAQEKGAQPPSVPYQPPSSPPASAAGDRHEEVVPMTRLRRTLAERLVDAQHNAALLTTFNEIDMSGVISLRKGFGEAFLQKYKIKLGFMGFFVKASIEALKAIPQVNAEIRGTDLIYKNYYDIGVAIGGGRGLVVPVLRNAERMSFAEIETTIADFAKRAQENKLKLEELQGGTFTISNGGVYGSLLSTPIINPPQSGILGMHTIQERPVAHEGNVVIRPMMYVALTYDHRIVDGREAVTFLRRIKDLLESPARILLEV
jgi:2-oxoglutarate dehydrogenase E2 component (dihydrolipoamide succinyltransferase)